MPRLAGLAYAMTGNQADAEDLVQDTLALVITKWSRVSEPGGGAVPGCGSCG